jgi:DNA-binding CsgD family transcriptional regulator
MGVIPVMRVARVAMRQCSELRELGAEGYLGFNVSGCPGRVEHVVVRGRRVVRFQKRCDDCILSFLARKTHLLGMPVLRSDGTIVFTVPLDKTVRRLLRENRDNVVSVEEVDYREVFLTERQRTVIRLISTGEASNISRVAEKLGISKPAAYKIVRSALRKLAGRHV